ncbi:MAG: hypothetical protein U0166_14555 [Acidobacteriota bacterium]
MDVISAAPGELTETDGRLHWDLTSHVTSRLAQREALYLALGARNCHGCEILATQLGKHGAAFGPSTLLIEALGGDFLDGAYVQDVAVGRLGLAFPGIPVGVLFDVAREAGDTTRLDFRALSIGPFGASDPAAGIAALRSGRSQVVPEAEGVVIKACIGPVCLTLSARNDFHVPFSIKLAGDRP